MQPDEDVIKALLDGPVHRFSDALSSEIPASGAGVYTVWDDHRHLVYVGVAGRNPHGKGLANRLRSHASGRRSGDQFCVYVADHYVMPELSRGQVREIAASELSMDGLVRERIHADFAFRVATVQDYKAALAVETWIKSGSARCGPPRLNPA
jgi:hypothetical protein